MREGAKTILLLILTGLLLFLASKLWVKFPERVEEEETKEVTEFSADHLMKEIVAPQKVVINFSEGEHTVIYDLQKGWNDYIEIIKRAYTFDKAPDEIKKITLEEYMEMHQEKSVVFQFDELWNIRLFMNLLGIDPQDMEDAGKVRFNEIYISTEGSYVVLRGEENCYKIGIQKNTFKDLNERIENLYTSKQYKEYVNFLERYGIPESIYVPKQTENIPRTVAYHNELDVMEKTFRNDLAERFLGRDVDYIGGEIIEDSGTTYVYETKSLRLNTGGLLEYKDIEEFESKEANLYVSLGTAIDFISSRTGINSNLTIGSIEQVTSGENVGYRIGFNFKENARTVYLEGSELKDYLMIDVYNSHVKQLQFLYRKAEEEGAIKEDTPQGEGEAYSLRDILEKNLTYFYPEGIPPNIVNPVSELLWKVTDVNMVYIDNIGGAQEVNLAPVWAIDIGDSTHFFDMVSGQWIMER